MNDQCTCVKDKEITCIVHPTPLALHRYISELQTENGRLHEALDTEIADLRLELISAHGQAQDALEELDKFRNGYKGGCYACETVGEKNVKLQQALDMEAARGAEVLAENARFRYALISITKMLDAYGVDYARSTAFDALGGNDE